MIAERFPATLELALAAAVIALAAGVPLDDAVAAAGVLAHLLIGILLILIFAFTLKWLPSFGRGEEAMLGP